MLATTNEEKELRREIYSLRRELRQDLREVRAFAKEEILAPKSALKKMTNVENYMRKKSVSKMNKEELQSTYRKLKYIRELNSSTLEGATRQVEHLGSIIPNINKLSKRQLDKLWSTYEKIVGGNTSLIDYKYDIYGGIVDVISNSNISSDELAIRVEQLYDKVHREGQVDEDDVKDETTKLILRSFKPIL